MPDQRSMKYILEKLERSQLKVRGVSCGCSQSVILTLPIFSVVMHERHCHISEL